MHQEMGLQVSLDCTRQGLDLDLPGTPWAKVLGDSWLVSEYSDSPQDSVQPGDSSADWGWADKILEGMELHRGRIGRCYTLLVFQEFEGCIED